MTEDYRWIQPLSAAHEVAAVGGKAASLARMINAGIPVPAGFAVTTRAFRAWRDAGGGVIPPLLLERILLAYRSLDGAIVAVRSSATAEDGAEMSMAGQYDTLLGIHGENALIDAVVRCWRAADSARVKHYLKEHHVDPAGVSLALVVQRLVPAEAAGVLFTANPRNGRREEMLLEAAWGLGEAVVSGEVQPDVLVLERETGGVIDAVIAEKTVRFDPGSGGMVAVSDEQRSAPVLGGADVQALASWGRRIEELHGSPQDIEWALVQGRVSILQARPITTLAVAAAREASRIRTRERLRDEADQGRGPWIVHNLGETAPRPTPLTWSVLRRFMSGGGGYGSLQRELGFTPSAAVATEGFLELIGGRVYMDLRRSTEMFGEGFPYRYDLERLRTDSEAAHGPPSVPAGSFRALWGAGRIMKMVDLRLLHLARDLDTRFEREVLPAFSAWIATESARRLDTLDNREWLELWHARERRVMDEFAPAALLPSVVCVHATMRLRAFLALHFSDLDPEMLFARLSVPLRPDVSVASNTGLRKVAEGGLDPAGWLHDFGHRAPEEFELSTPRWSERPEAVAGLANHLRGHEDPLARHAARHAEAADCLVDLCRRLGAHDARTLRELAAVLSRYLPYREDGKHHLMRGYHLLRDLALEAARRLGIGDDVFFLTPDEIDRAMRTGYAPFPLIEQRRHQRNAERELDLPQFILPQDIETLGDPPAVAAHQERLKSSPLAGGSASGPVRILTAPDQIASTERGFVLVCASTDIGWTPLFASAAAVIVERGGSLSHGAVVAREMGAPAVCLPNATRLFHDGEIVTVHGDHGWVLRGAARGDSVDQLQDSDPDAIPRELTPPAPSAREAWASRLRRNGFLGWGVFLAAFFILPRTWLRDPTLGLLDVVLWPLVANAGKVVTVALIAAVTATLTLVGQRCLNDHRRLVLAKACSARLQAAVRTLPPDSGRRRRWLQASRAVQSRLTMAAFTPLAVLLGPMVISFIWLTERIDPAVWNPGPGSTAEIVAVVEGDHTGPVAIQIPGILTLAAHSAVEQSIPRIREVLTTLLGRWQGAPPTEGLSWDVKAAALRTRTELLDDLRAYLGRPIPAQNLAWTVALPPAAGRFDVTVRASDASTLSVALVTGEASPPPPRTVMGTPQSPLRELRVDYREARVRGDRIFWAPFDRWGWNWDAGWLGTYLAAYLPLMFALRLLLRLP